VDVLEGLRRQDLVVREGREVVVVRLLGLAPWWQVMQMNESSGLAGSLKMTSGAGSPAKVGQFTLST